MDRICKIMLDKLLKCDEVSDSEEKFIDSLQGATFLTERQADILEEIYDRRVL